MKKFAAFDMDGTILDTLDGLRDSCNYGLEKMGFPTHEREAYRYFVGNGVPKLLERSLPEGERTPERLAEYKAHFDEHYARYGKDGTHPYPGVAEVLAALREAGVILAVVSNKPPEYGRVFAEDFFGKGLFSAVLGPDDKIPPKPDPRGLLLTMEELGVTAEESCFFGDTDVDVMTGKNAGVYTAGVAWGFRPEAELLRAGADCILHERREILGVVGLR